MESKFHKNLKGIKAKQYASYHHWYEEPEELSDEFNHIPNYEAFWLSNHNVLLFNFDNLEASTYFGGKQLDVVYMSANHEMQMTVEGIVKK